MLDESLLSALGCIKFKVIIITKSAWCGINKHIVTDVETEFFLKVIFNNGKYTYEKNENKDKLNTADIVCELCNPL